MSLAFLNKLGWVLDDEKLRNELEKVGKQELLKATKRKELHEFLLNIDLSKVSQFKNDLSKIDRPIVLQLMHWRNATHSFVQNHQGNTGVCRLKLSDGHQAVDGFSTEPLRKLSGKTPYGSKVLLKVPIEMEAGLLILTKNNLELLGGDVQELKKLWSNERMQIDASTSSELSSNAPKWESVDSYEEKKREADQICQNFNSFKCLTNTPWLNQQADNENSETNIEFKQKRKLAVDSIIVPRKRPRFLFHRHW